MAAKRPFCIGFRQMSNSSEILCPCSYKPNLKLIRQKMKSLSCSQAIVDARTDARTHVRPPLRTRGYSISPFWTKSKRAKNLEGPQKILKNLEDRRCIYRLILKCVQKQLSFSVTITFFSDSVSKNCWKIIFGHWAGGHDPKPPSGSAPGLHSYVSHSLLSKTAQAEWHNPFFASAHYTQSQYLYFNKKLKHTNPTN